jgi:hypothetical protein
MTPFNRRPLSSFQIIALFLIHADFAMAFMQQAVVVAPPRTYNVLIVRK